MVRPFISRGHMRFVAILTTVLIGGSAAHGNAPVPPMTYYSRPQQMGFRASGQRAAHTIFGGAQAAASGVRAILSGQPLRGAAQVAAGGVRLATGGRATGAVMASAT